MSQKEARSKIPQLDKIMKNVSIENSEAVDNGLLSEKAVLLRRYRDVIGRLSNLKNEYLKRIESLLELWDCAAALEPQSTAEAKEDILHTVLKQTVRLILIVDWVKVPSETRDIIRERINNIIPNLKPNSENLFRCEYILKNIDSPWGDEGLIKILSGNPWTFSDTDLDFLSSERGSMIILRLQKLCETKCDAMAFAWSSKALSAYRSVDEKHVLKKSISSRQHAFLFDVFLCYLHKYGHVSKIIDEVKLLDLESAQDLIKRHSYPTLELPRLLKYRPRVARLASDIIIAKLMLEDITEQNEQYYCDILKEWLCLRKTVPKAEFHTYTSKLCSTAISNKHLYLACDVIKSMEVAEWRDLVLELSIRAIQSDLNELELMKSEKSCDEKIVIKNEVDLSIHYHKLADLLRTHPHMAQECVLTAFSLNPTKDNYNLVKEIAHNNIKSEAEEGASSNEVIQRSTRTILPAMYSSSAASAPVDVPQKFVEIERVGTLEQMLGQSEEVKTEIKTESEYFPDHDVIDADQCGIKGEIKNEPDQSIQDKTNNVYFDYRALSPADNKQYVKNEIIGLSPMLAPIMSKAVQRNAEKQSPDADQSVEEKEKFLVPRTIISSSTSGQRSVPFNMRALRASIDCLHSITGCSKLVEAPNYDAFEAPSLILDRSGTTDLPDHLRMDLSVMLSSPRHKSLSWMLPWHELDVNCQKLLKEECKLTIVRQSLAVANDNLKFLNLDYNQFRHLPESECPGIEKGYEIYSADFSDEAVGNSEPKSRKPRKPKIKTEKAPKSTTIPKLPKDRTQKTVKKQPKKNAKASGKNEDVDELTVTEHEAIQRTLYYQRLHVTLQLSQSLALLQQCAQNNRNFFFPHLETLLKDRIGDPTSSIAQSEQNNSLVLPSLPEQSQSSKKSTATSLLRTIPKCETQLEIDEFLSNLATCTNPRLLQLESQESSSMSPSSSPSSSNGSKVKTVYKKKFQSEPSTSKAAPSSPKLQPNPFVYLSKSLQNKMASKASCSGIATKQKPSTSPESLDSSGSARSLRINKRSTRQAPGVALIKSENTIVVKPTSSRASAKNTPKQETVPSKAKKSNLKVQRKIGTKMKPEIEPNVDTKKLQSEDSSHNKSSKKTASVNEVSKIADKDSKQINVPEFKQSPEPVVQNSFSGIFPKVRPTFPASSVENPSPLSSDFEQETTLTAPESWKYINNQDCGNLALLAESTWHSSEIVSEFGRELLFLGSDIQKEVEVITEGSFNEAVPEGATTYVKSPTNILQTFSTEEQNSTVDDYLEVEEILAGFRKTLDTNSSTTVTQVKENIDIIDLLLDMEESSKLTEAGGTQSETQDSLKPLEDTSLVSNVMEKIQNEPEHSGEVQLLCGESAAKMHVEAQDDSVKCWEDDIINCFESRYKHLMESVNRSDCTLDELESVEESEQKYSFVNQNGNWVDERLESTDDNCVEGSDLTAPVSVQNDSIVSNLTQNSEQQLVNVDPVDLTKTKTNLPPYTEPDSFYIIGERIKTLLKSEGDIYIPRTDFPNIDITPKLETTHIKSEDLHDSYHGEDKVDETCSDPRNEVSPSSPEILPDSVPENLKSELATSIEDKSCAADLTKGYCGSSMRKLSRSKNRKLNGTRGKNSRRKSELANKYLVESENVNKGSESPPKKSIIDKDQGTTPKAAFNNKPLQEKNEPKNLSPPVGRIDILTNEKKCEELKDEYKDLYKSTNDFKHTDNNTSLLRRSKRRLLKRSDCDSENGLDVNTYMESVSVRKSDLASTPSTPDNSFESEFWTENLNDMSCRESPIIANCEKYSPVEASPTFIALPTPEGSPDGELPGDTIDIKIENINEIVDDIEQINNSSKIQPGFETKVRNSINNEHGDVRTLADENSDSELAMFLGNTNLLKKIKPDYDDVDVNNHSMESESVHSIHFCSSLSLSARGKRKNDSTCDLNCDVEEHENKAGFVEPLEPAAKRRISSNSPECLKRSDTPRPAAVQRPPNYCGNHDRFVSISHSPEVYNAGCDRRIMLLNELNNQKNSKTETGGAEAEAGIAKAESQNVLRVNDWAMFFTGSERSEAEIAAEKAKLRKVEQGEEMQQADWDVEDDSADACVELSIKVEPEQEVNEPSKIRRSVRKRRAKKDPDHVSYWLNDHVPSIKPRKSMRSSIDTEDSVESLNSQTINNGGRSALRLRDSNVKVKYIEDSDSDSNGKTKKRSKSVEAGNAEYKVTKDGYEVRRRANGKPKRKYVRKQPTKQQPVNKKYINSVPAEFQNDPKLYLFTPVVPLHRCKDPKIRIDPDIIVIESSDDSDCQLISAENMPRRKRKAPVPYRSLLAPRKVKKIVLKNIRSSDIAIVNESSSSSPRTECELFYVNDSSKAVHSLAPNTSTASQIDKDKQSGAFKKQGKSTPLPKLDASTLNKYRSTKPSSSKNKRDQGMLQDSEILKKPSRKSTQNSNDVKKPNRVKANKNTVQLKKKLCASAINFSNKYPIVRLKRLKINELPVLASDYELQGKRKLLANPQKRKQKGCSLPSNLSVEGVPHRLNNLDMFQVSSDDDSSSEAETKRLAKIPRLDNKISKNCNVTNSLSKVENLYRPPPPVNEKNLLYETYFTSVNSDNPVTMDYFFNYKKKDDSCKLLPDPSDNFFTLSADIIQKKIAESEKKRINNEKMSMQDNNLARKILDTTTKILLVLQKNDKENIKPKFLPKVQDKGVNEFFVDKKKRWYSSKKLFNIAVQSKDVSAENIMPPTWYDLREVFDHLNLGKGKWNNQQDTNECSRIKAENNKTDLSEQLLDIPDFDFLKYFRAPSYHCLPVVRIVHSALPLEARVEESTISESTNETTSKIPIIGQIPSDPPKATLVPFVHKSICSSTNSHVETSSGNVRVIIPQSSMVKKGFISQNNSTGGKTSTTLIKVDKRDDRGTKIEPNFVLIGCGGNNKLLPIKKEDHILLTSAANSTESDVAKSTLQQCKVVESSAFKAAPKLSVTSDKFVVGTGSSGTLVPVQFIYKSEGGMIHLTPVPSDTSIQNFNLAKDLKTISLVKADLKTSLGTSTDSSSSAHAAFSTRSLYEENYAKFIQTSSSANASNAPQNAAVVRTIVQQTSSSSEPSVIKASLPKFTQAFGKSVYIEESEKTPAAVVKTFTDTATITAKKNIEKTSTPSGAFLLTKHNTVSRPATVEGAANLLAKGTMTRIVAGPRQHLKIIQTDSSGISVAPPSTGQRGTLGSPVPISVPIVQQAALSNFVHARYVRPFFHLSQGNMPSGQGQTQQQHQVLITTTHPPSTVGNNSSRTFSVNNLIVSNSNNILTTTSTRIRCTPTLTIAKREKSPQPPAQLEKKKINEGGHVDTSTLEQLREFDLVLEQVKERSTTSVTVSTNNERRSSGNDKLLASALPTTGKAEVSTKCVTISPVKIDGVVKKSDDPKVGHTALSQGKRVNFTQLQKSPIVMVGNNVARTKVSSTPSKSTSARPNVPIDMIRNEIRTTQATQTAPTTLPTLTTLPQTRLITPTKLKPVQKINTMTSVMPMSSQYAPKISKPQEDEQTVQRIYDILAEYAEQLRNSPDLNNKPAPRRRSNPLHPCGPNTKKRKNFVQKSSDGITTTTDLEQGLDSEDSSCATSSLYNRSPMHESSTSVDNSSHFVGQHVTVVNSSSKQLEGNQIHLRQQSQQQNQAVNVINFDMGNESEMNQTAALFVPGKYIFPLNAIKTEIVEAAEDKEFTPPAQQVIYKAKPIKMTENVVEQKTTFKPITIQSLRQPIGFVQNNQMGCIEPTGYMQKAGFVIQAQPSNFAALQSQRNPFKVFEMGTVKNISSDLIVDSHENYADPKQKDKVQETSVITKGVNLSKLSQIPGTKCNESKKPNPFNNKNAHNTLLPVVHSTSATLTKLQSETAKRTSDKIRNNLRLDSCRSSSSRILTQLNEGRKLALERELKFHKSLSDECEDLGVDEPSTSDLFPEADLLFDPTSSAFESSCQEDLPSVSAVKKQPPQVLSKEGRMRPKTPQIVVPNGGNTSVSKHNLSGTNFRSMSLREVIGWDTSDQTSPKSTNLVIQHTSGSLLEIDKNGSSWPSSGLLKSESESAGEEVDIIIPNIRKRRLSTRGAVKKSSNCPCGTSTTTPTTTTVLSSSIQTQSSFKCAKDTMNNLSKTIKLSYQPAIKRMRSIKVNTGVLVAKPTPISSMKTPQQRVDKESSDTPDPPRSLPNSSVVDHKQTSAAAVYPARRMVITSRNPRGVNRR